MRKKLYNIPKGKDKEFYVSLKKKQKKIKIQSAIFLIVLLGVNTFAWFTYIEKADFNFNAKVVNWDIKLFNDDKEVNNVTFDVGNIYPGFGDSSVNSNNVPFKKTIKVTNSGELVADFKYDIKSFSIMGKEILPKNITVDEKAAFVKDTFPFTITTTADKFIIRPNEMINFDWQLYWLYEDNNKYFKLNEIYEYDPSFTYYTYSNGQYVETSVTNDNYLELRDTLYLTKDDADSYFGSKCSVYEKATGNKCVNMKIQLTVSQVLE